jgi:hypothetical protein
MCSGSRVDFCADCPRPRRLLSGNERRLLYDHNLARRNVARRQHADAAAVRGLAHPRGVTELHYAVYDLGEPARILTCT